MKVVIAAAGTGGHINPGIAIANKIMNEEPDSEIIFIGTKRGLENDLVPRAGYELKTIESYGISRSLTISNFKRLFKTLHSISVTKNILKEFKPDLVIGTGGYICISVCEAAYKLKIPFMIHESNVLPGVATKLLAKKAKKILVGFPESKDKLSKNATVVATGTPTKVTKLNFSKTEIENKKSELGLSKKEALVLVFGGSQGAESINNSMIEIIENNLNKDYQIVWAAGPKQYDIVKEKLSENHINIDKLDKIKVMPYIYNMDEMLNISDLVVCRSGAMTVTEIEKVGKPAIFIPYPYAAENHQEYNARVIEKAGAGKVILDKDLNSKILNKEISKMVSDFEKLEKMGKNSNKLSIDNVEDRIYTEITKG